MEKMIKAIRNIALILILLTTINTSLGLVANYKGYYTGVVKYEGTDITVAGLPIRVNCQSASASTTTASDGSYTLLTSIFPSTIIPTCTIAIDDNTMTTSYTTNRNSVLATSSTPITVNPSVSGKINYKIVLSADHGAFSTTSVTTSGEGSNGACVASGSTHTCPVLSGKQFTVTITATDFNSKTLTKTINTLTEETITLNRIILSHSVKTQVDSVDVTATITISGNGAISYNSETKKCSIYSGMPLVITGELDGYVTQEIELTTSTDNGETTINFEPTVVLSISGNPSTGTITAGTITKTADGSTSYSLPLSPGAYTITYKTTPELAKSSVTASSESQTNVNFYRALLTINDGTNPITDASVSINYNSNNLACLNNGGGAYTCYAPNGNTLITITHSNYNTVTRTPTINSADYSETISMNRETVTLTVTPNVPATVEQDSSGTYTTCTGGACTISSGVPFNLRVSANGYVTQVINYPSGINDNTARSVNLLETLKVTINPSVVKGVITADSAGAYDQTINIESNYHANGEYYLALDPAGSPYTISYSESSGRYTQSSGGGAVTISSSSQTSNTITINENKYNQDLIVNDSNNNNAPITDATIIAVYDGSNHACNYNTNKYTCVIPHNTEYNIIASKTGYVTKTMYITNQLITSAPAETSMGLERTLRIGLVDDFYNPVNAGTIYINNSANTQTIIAYSLTGNTQSQLYFALPPQTINVYFIDGDDYTKDEKESEIITSASQKLVTLGPIKTWRTDINVFSPTGIEVGATITTDGNECTSYCILNQHSLKIKVEKTGYTTSEINIPSNNNGSPISIQINQTLMINVTDQNNNPASGLISIKKVDGTTIYNETIEGAKWIALNPVLNNELLKIQFTSQGFINQEVTLNPGSINNGSTRFINIETASKIVLSADIKDYYSSEPISVYSIRTWRYDTTYSTSNPINFELMNPPETVNISLTKTGYYNKEIADQSIYAGEITIFLTPRAVVYLNTKANITVINTKKTIGTNDDDKLYTIESSDLGIAGLPINEGVEFMINITSNNHKSRILGPYTTTNETVIIGSSSNPIVLEPLPIYETGTPIVKSINYLPSNPNNNTEITIIANASDEGRGNNTITRCNIQVDNGLFTMMNGFYNDYIITVNKNIGKLSAGPHTITIACKDDVSGWGENKIITINVAVEQQIITPEETKSYSERLNDLKTKQELLIMSGFSTTQINQAIMNAEESINTPSAEQAINEAEQTMPLITLSGSTTIKTTSNYMNETIMQRIAQRENQPYTISELKNNLQENIMFTKTAKRYLLDGEEKTIITIMINSQENNPDAIIADFNPGESNAFNTVTNSQGSISYFKGLTKGENVFTHVIEGFFNETPEPIVFTMKTLSESDKTIKSVTGFTVGVPGVFELPVIYLGIGLIALIVIIKLLF